MSSMDVPSQSPQNDPLLLEQLRLKDRALASAAEGITIADALLPDRPLVYVNEGFARLTGYPVEEVLGSNCRFLQGKDTDPQAVQEIREAIAAKRYCEVELLNYRKDGSSFWNNLSITPILNELGQTTHFVGIQTDVTRRRVAEQQLRDANDNLRRINHRLHEDLRAAAKIQQSLLPTNLSDIQDVQLGWSLISCDELAGDILDVFELDDRRLAFYVLDVSGHGVQAALLSTTLSRWLSKLPGGLKAEPVAVLEHLNDNFQMDGQTTQFFTICYAVMDVKQRKLSIASAGHPAPIHVQRGQIREITRPGFPIGVVPVPQYELTTIDLCPGDRVFVYSDGAIEQVCLDDRPFGVERLKREILNGSDTSVQLSIDSSLGTLLRQIPDGKNTDDISMVGISLLG